MRKDLSLRALFLCALNLCLAECSCSPTHFEKQTYACTTDSECIQNYRCLNNVCTPPSENKIVFAAETLSQLKNVCSDAATIEVRNSNGATVHFDTPLALQLESTTNVIFYEDSACTKVLPSSPLILEPGKSELQFHTKETKAGTSVVTVRSQGYAPIQLNLNVVESLNVDHIAFTTHSLTVHAGLCSQEIRLESQNVANALAPPTISFTAQLTSMPLGVSFYSDANCTTAVTSTRFGTDGSARFFTKSISGATFSLSATGPETLDATQLLTVAPMVRRGRCDILSSDTVSVCNLVPPLAAVNDAFVVHQTATASGAPNSASARCLVTAPSTLRCERAAVGPQVSVGYQIVELPNALKVQQVPFSCDGGVGFAQSTLTTPVVSSEAFVIHSQAIEGAELDADDFFTTQLENQTTLSLTWGTPTCPSSINPAIQVIEWRDSSVTRGGISTGFLPFSASSGFVMASPTSLATSFPLSSYLLSFGSAAQSCDRALRTRYNDALGRIELSRGVADYAGCSATGSPATADVDAFTFEKIDLGRLGRVQVFEVNMATGVMSAAVAIQPVDMTRTLVFASQGPAGQGMGETDVTTNSTLGNMNAIHSLDGGIALFTADSLTLERQSAQGAARWTSYVIEIQP